LHCPCCWRRSTSVVVGMATDLNASWRTGYACPTLGPPSRSHFSIDHFESRPRSWLVALTRKSKHGKAPEHVPDLTPAQTKELLRRLADSSDPRRYLIISRMLPGARFILYYNVSDDVYAWNDPEGGTLFKRRKAAELIQRKLGRGNEVIEVKKVRGLVLRSSRAT